MVTTPKVRTKEIIPGTNPATYIYNYLDIDGTCIPLRTVESMDLEGLTLKIQFKNGMVFLLDYSSYNEAVLTFAQAYKEWIAYKIIMDYNEESQL